MSTLTARDVMNPDVFTVRIDLTLSELAAFFAEKQITGAPVADRDGRLVGVVSLMDLAENQAARGALVVERTGAGAGASLGWEGKMEVEEARRLHVEDVDLTVGDVMTPAIYSVPEDTPVAQIARTLVSGRIHRLFVTRRGRMVGIVTTLDLLRLLADDESPPRIATRSPRSRTPGRRG